MSENNSSDNNSLENNGNLIPIKKVKKKEPFTAKDVKLSLLSQDIADAINNSKYSSSLEPIDIAAILVLLSRQIIENHQDPDLNQENVIQWLSSLLRRENEE